MNDTPFERIPVYGPQAAPPEPAHMTEFKEKTGNSRFRRSWLTWVSLVFLIHVYPGISMIGISEDPATLLKSLDQTMLMIMLISTVIMQWGIFIWLLLSLMKEGTGLAGIGFKRIRGIDFAWAAAFLMAANLILSGLAWVLAQVGLPMPGEISLLVPQDTAGRILWVFVALTAGICEETAFRGYLMTRLRLVGRFSSWVIPTIISAVVFGACHAYQGVPGLIVISVYGAMFSLMYIKTGSIWPVIIAHFFQDFMALFIPR